MYLGPKQLFFSHGVIKLYWEAGATKIQIFQPIATQLCNLNCKSMLELGEKLVEGRNFLSQRLPGRLAYESMLVKGGFFSESATRTMVL